MSSSAVVPVPTLGRFELKRVLGRGAQSTVWLGFDPRLEREVAIKLMSLPSGGAGGDATAALERWLREARTVGRLAHPHIVPVFEADVQADGRGAQPYIVFEYVPGSSLAERLRQQGPYAPRAAAELMLGVLDALAQAHASGVVHRDLKPSNVLIDAAGRARVTDFGIAASLGDGAGVTPAGSPGYLSPEAVRGQSPAPSMDVFAAGLVLAELMTGKPLIADVDARRAMYRIAHEDLSLPTVMPQPVDDGLRALVQRALARDPSVRFAHAGEMRDALMAWLAPKSPAVQDHTGSGLAAGKPNASGTLEFLLRRMRHKSDFPALSDSVASIQRVAASENESLSSLANEILKDVALTHKLLRLVNTAHYQHAGGGTVSTVSRAVALVGFAGIRNLALSLVLLEHMNDKLHADQIKQEFLRSLMAGTLATELSPVANEGEEAFIGSMFQGLGRLLTEFYFHEEAEQIRSLVHPGVTMARETPKPPMGEQAASTSVLGLSYEELGLGVARTWGLPDTLQRCMRAAVGAPPQEVPKPAPERLRWLATAANEMADMMLHAAPEDAPRLVGQVAERHAKALGVKPKDVQDAVARARTRLTQLAHGLQLHLKPGSPAERLLEPKAQLKDSERDPMTDTLTRHQLEATAPVPHDAAAAAHEDPAHVLAAGIQDITNSMVAEDFKLNEVLRMILETMYRALAFRRVVFCLRDGRTGKLVGRFGLGEGAEQVVALFQVPLSVAAGGNPDLFTAVCLKGADTMISDATGSIESRLPAWFREKVKAPTFLLLPLSMKNATFGLIYADKARPGGITLSEKELSLLRTLRNQAVMAFRTANSG